MSGADNEAARAQGDRERIEDPAGRVSPAEDACPASGGEGAVAGATGSAGEAEGEDCGSGAPDAGVCSEASPCQSPSGPVAPVSRLAISPALRAEIVEYVQAFAIAIVLAAFIITFIAQSFVVEGSSMEPNLHNRERLLVNKLVYRFKEPQRGDVVVFRYPANPRRKFIKRVIGVPGDMVEVRDGHVILNGEVLEEDYTMDLTFGTFGPEVVPAGHYFVLGDNRNNSDDSRFPDVGFVPRRNIVGKAFVAWWPPGEIGLLRTPKLGAGVVAE
jgi:signal peptidase I